MIGKFGYTVLALVLLLSVFGVRAEQHTEDEHDDFKAEFGDEKDSFSEGTEDDHIEVREQSAFTKPKPILVKDLPPMRFIFCVSCGYKNAFDQYSQFIKEKYPEMQVEGTNYPPAPWKAYLAQAVNIFKMILLFSIISGASNPIPVLRDLPMFAWAQQNKLSACMMTFLLSNMVEGFLMSTGAFEIFLGNEQIWSKIESGRVPSPQELLQMIDSQLELMGKIPPGGGGFGAGVDFDN